MGHDRDDVDWIDLFLVIGIVGMKEIYLYFPSLNECHREETIQWINFH